MTAREAQQAGDGMAARLSEAERRGFREAGYCGPVRVMSADEAGRYRAALERFERRWPDERHMLDQGASLLCPWIDEFTRLPGLLDPVEDLLGPNLLVWGVSLRLKEPDGQTFAGWHQDTAYCDIRPIVVIAALALSDCGSEAGCLRVIPGSHRGPLLPHREHFGTASLLTREQQIEAPIDEAAAVALPLAAGEALLFDNAICHASGPNVSGERRIVFLVEYVPTHAYQHEPRESAMLVRGVDRFHHFDADPRPAEEMSSGARAAWRRKVEVQAEVLYRGAAHPTRALASGS